MIQYYNRKDWKSKKGKLGKLDEEFIGSIIEKQTNTKDQIEDIVTVRGEITIEQSAENLTDTI